MDEIEIFKAMTIEEFLRKFDLVNEANIEVISRKIRYQKTNAMKIDINNDGIVEINQGVFKGNKAKVLSQYGHNLEVRILDDEYANVVVIDINDLAITYEKTKTEYVLI